MSIFKKLSSSEVVFFSPCIGNLLSDNWKWAVILELSITATLTFGCIRLVSTVHDYSRRVKFWFLTVML
jgi:hypothetical protein